MRILVTGGAGFIGSHLCERLVSDGHEVLCVDSLFTGRRENLRALLGHPRFEFLRHDVCDPLHTEVDQIYALACPASPVHYAKNPVRTIRTCVEGTLRALDLAREVGARVLLTSTSEVYGTALVHPQPESYWGNVNPVGVRSCYDQGKRCAEALCVSYATQFGVEVRIARLFNCYGPRLAFDDGRVVSNFVLQALRGDPLTVYGAGSQTRSFCYVSDTVEALVRLMGSDESRPVNIGNPDEITIRQLAERVSGIVGAPLRVVPRGLPGDDPERRRPDITRAREVLGWEPRVGLDEGLARTIEDFQARLRVG